jgi:hypothetical protein
MSARYAKTATWALGAAAMAIGVAGPLMMGGTAQAKAGDTFIRGRLDAVAPYSLVNDPASYAATASTQLDGFGAAGPQVGDCVKLKFRAGALHEVDKEPARDCR